jgi:crooked neck
VDCCAAIAKSVGQVGKFEEERAKLDNAREVFHNALEFYGDDEEQVEKAQAV